MEPTKLYFINKHGKDWQKEYERHVWALHLDDVVRRASESGGKPEDMTLMMSPQSMKAYRELLGPPETKVRK